MALWKPKAAKPFKLLGKTTVVPSTLRTTKTKSGEIKITPVKAHFSHAKPKKW